MSLCAPDAGPGAVGFNVCPAGFPSCFGPNFPFYPLFLSLGIGTIAVPWSFHEPTFPVHTTTLLQDVTSRKYVT
jgi:hypothetical protein